MSDDSARRGPPGTGLPVLALAAATIYQLLGISYDDWPYLGWGYKAILAAGWYPVMLMAARYAWKEEKRWSLEALGYMGASILFLLLGVASLTFWLRDQ